MEGVKTVSMESQVADELIDALVQRLKDVAAKVLEPDLSAQKEKRQYETKFLRLSHQSLYIQPESIGDHDYFPEWLKDAGDDNVANRLLCLFMRSLEFHDEQLRVKPSMNSTARGTSVCHFDNLKRAVRNITYDRMPTLREVLIQYGAADIHDCAMGGEHVYENLFVQDFLKLLRNETVPSVNNWKKLQESWPRSIDIKLSTKLYLNRMDRRTYGSDSLPIRSLVGSIIHALLLPFGKFDNHRPYNRSIPVKKKKDTLILDFEIAQRNEYTLIFGDISSFTASISNLWVLLLETTYMIERDGLNKKIVVDIAGSLVETSLKEVLRLFVFLGGGAGIMDGEELFFLKGAILGVAGVDTVAKVLFGLILESICATIPDVVTARPQAGGDDFYIGLITRSSRPEYRISAVRYIREEVERVVGRLKEFTYETLPDNPVDYISENTFCKKQIRIASGYLQNGRLQIKIHSQWSLPFLGTLITRPKDEILGAIGIWSTILGSVPWVPDYEFLCDLLFSIYAESGNTYLSLLRTVKITDANEDDLYGFTSGALRILSAVDPVADSDGHYYKTNYKARLSSIESGRLERVWVNVGGGRKKIICKRGELKCSAFKVPYRTPSHLTVPDLRLVEAYGELRDLTTNLTENIG